MIYDIRTFREVRGRPVGAGAVAREAVPASTRSSPGRAARPKAEHLPRILLPPA